MNSYQFFVGLHQKPFVVQSVKYVSVTIDLSIWITVSILPAKKYLNRALPTMRKHIDIHSVENDLTSSFFCTSQMCIVHKNETLNKYKIDWVKHCRHPEAERTHTQKYANDECFHILMFEIHGRHLPIVISFGSTENSIDFKFTSFGPMFWHRSTSSLFHNICSSFVMLFFYTLFASVVLFKWLCHVPWSYLICETSSLFNLVRKWEYFLWNAHFDAKDIYEHDRNRLSCTLFLCVYSSLVMPFEMLFPHFRITIQKAGKNIWYEYDIRIWALFQNKC